MTNTTARKRLPRSTTEYKKRRKEPEALPPVKPLTAEESYATGVTRALTNTLNVRCLTRRKAVYHFIRALQLAGKSSADPFDKVRFRHHARKEFDECIAAMGLSLE